ncbi:hypothetical protein IFM89_008268 [Coptis chinensis]|uniref:Uncharacterized protein n=1 Tax=Coptis chinensis TaxID=261450 RepID=A0A835ICR7_9MAGN|nr:hypothetical protein IFM89_008268 [Coptis chinensis]
MKLSLEELATASDYRRLLLTQFWCTALIFIQHWGKATSYKKHHRNVKMQVKRNKATTCDHCFFICLGRVDLCFNVGQEQLEMELPLLNLLDSKSSVVWRDGDVASDCDPQLFVEKARKCLSAS